MYCEDNSKGQKTAIKKKKILKIYLKTQRDLK